MNNKLYKIITDLVSLPTVQNGLIKGDFTEKEVRAEYEDQIINKDTVDGLDNLIGLSSELKNRIKEYQLNPKED